MLKKIGYFMKGSFFKESSLAMIEQGISSITSFLTSIILARNVNANSVGMYTLLLSIALIIIGLQRVFILVPFNIYYPKMKEATDKKYYAAKTMGFEIIFLTVVIIILVLSKLTGIIDIKLNISSSLIFIIGYLLKDYTRQFLFGINKISTSLVIGILQSFIQIALFIILIYLNNFTINNCLIIIGVTAGIISIVFLTLNTTISIKFNDLVEVWNKNKDIAKWSVGISLSDSVKNQVSIWMLNNFVSTKSVGIYSIHNTFAMLPQPIFNGLSQYLLPHFSQLFAQKEYESVIKKSIIAIVVVLFMNVFWGVILLVMGKELIILIYGEQYIGITMVLLLCCIRGFFTSLSSIISSILQSIEKPKIILKSLVIGIVILIISGTVLTSKYSIVGMSISLSLSFGVIATIQIIELINIIKKLKVNEKIGER